MGRAGRWRIAKHKRLGPYRGEDYDALVAILSACSRIIVTPNVLTETSNLLGFANRSGDPTLALTLQQIITGMAEVYIPSGMASKVGEYRFLGLTDAGIIQVLVELADEHPTLLTMDARLAEAAGRRGHSVIKFNHRIGSLAS